MSFFLRNKRFNIYFFISDYQLSSAHAAKHVWVSFVNFCPPPPLPQLSSTKHSILYSVTENQFLPLLHLYQSRGRYLEFPSHPNTILKLDTLKKKINYNIIRYGFSQVCLQFSLLINNLCLTEIYKFKFYLTKNVRN